MDDFRGFLLFDTFVPFDLLHLFVCTFFFLFPIFRLHTMHEQLVGVLNYICSVFFNVGVRVCDSTRPKRNGKRETEEKSERAMILLALVYRAAVFLSSMG